MAKPELGTKRQCLNCGAKFYDLNKDPILCPKCGTPFVANLLRGRPEVVASTDDEETDVETNGAELVSLEDVEEGEGKALPGDDVDIDGDDNDDTFLEEEEVGDDDVSDLIDGDIEDDEES